MALDMVDEDDAEALRFGSDDWHAALEGRRGRPTGRHIRDVSAQEDEVVVSAMVEGPEFDEAIARALGRIREKETPQMPPRGRWLPSDWGSSNTLTAIVMIVGLGGTIFGGYTVYRDNQDRQNAAFRDARDQQNTFNTETLGTLRSLAQAIQANDLADKERTIRYAPQIEAATRLQDVTNTRLDNLAKSVADVREMVQDIGKTQMQDHTDVQVLKSRMDEHGPPARPN